MFIMFNIDIITFPGKSHYFSLIFSVRIFRVILCIFFNNLKPYHFRVNAFSSIYLKRKADLSFDNQKMSFPSLLPNIHYFKPIFYFILVTKH